MAAISYATLSLNFARVKDLPPSQVGSVIGGKVEAISRLIYSRMHVP